MASGNLQPAVVKNPKIARIFKPRMKILGDLDTNELRLKIDAFLPPHPPLFIHEFTTLINLILPQNMVTAPFSSHGAQPPTSRWTLMLRKSSSFNWVCGCSLMQRWMSWRIFWVGGGDD
uniref:Uncharacterized protein n=1 Tax=Opuntia streptacantha TaxID=393608 RepID=A0A7C9DZQ0_OPUST